MPLPADLADVAYAAWLRIAEEHGMSPLAAGVMIAKSYAARQQFERTMERIDAMLFTEERKSS